MLELKEVISPKSKSTGMKILNSGQFTHDVCPMNFPWAFYQVSNSGHQHAKDGLFPPNLSIDIPFPLTSLGSHRS